MLVVLFNFIFIANYEQVLPGNLLEKFNLVYNKNSFPEIEELLTPASTTTIATTTVTTTTTSSITSCSTSSSNGPHTLMSGVEVYCEDGWTVSERFSKVD